jgi:hypothetical protein
VSRHLKPNLLIEGICLNVYLEINKRERVDLTHSFWCGIIDSLAEYCAKGQIMEDKNIIFCPRCYSKNYKCNHFLSEDEVEESLCSCCGLTICLYADDENE